jgi:phospholipase C
MSYANNTPIQHVIILIQENRTPDNLFGSDAFANPRQLPKADLVTTGLCGTNTPPLQSIRLGDACDPDHSHGSWKTTYNLGGMNRACNIKLPNCTSITHPPYAYVQSSDMQPYLKIAQLYGYANYFFQTNQGPSFPAHQFLLSGTSAPTAFGDTTPCTDAKNQTTPCYQWFDAENYGGKDYGCTASGIAQVKDISPSPGFGENFAYNNGYPCYDHHTLVDLLDTQSGPITWKYYAHAAGSTTQVAGSLWTAPNAIKNLCVPTPTTNPGDVCTGFDWTHYVQSVFPHSAGYLNSFSPILTDLGADPAQPQCTLQDVSWVVPDGRWSDHGGEDPKGAGPSWVSAIINAVGGFDNDGNALSTNCGYWNNTVILVVWDDWGGWYDHVLPLNCDPGPNGVCHGYDGNAGKQYVYGFRVPLLVVSAYAKQAYVSGACVAPGNCPNEKAPFIHDFGSILNFIEWVFGNNQLPIGEISPQYHYADFFAPDAPNSPGCNPTLCKYSLKDFFDFSTQRLFTKLPQPIKTVCFINPSDPTCFGVGFIPSDPDADNVDPQD